MSYPALLHDPVSQTTRRVSVTWDAGFNGTLRIEENQGEQRNIAAADLSFARGGWRGDAIQFSWRHEDQIWAVTIDDPQAVANLSKELPSSLSSQIAAWQKQSRRSSRWSTTVVTIGALVTLLPLLLLLTLFMMRDRILDIVISRIPTRIDAEIGERMHQQLVASGKLVREGPAVEALRAVSRRFEPHLPKQDFVFRFEVVKDSTVNAFAAPGGLVVVHTGLLAKATSSDQLIGVLGHEITHVTRRHSLRQIIYDLGLATAVRWLLGAPDGIADTIAGAAADLSGLKFSREQETEADAGGLELLQKAKLPASGLQSLFDMLAQQQGSVPEFLSTHPADKDRFTALGKALAERGSWPVDPLTIDWDAVRRDAEK